MTGRWWESALCREIGGELFFGDDGDLGEVKHAKAICAQCDVTDACLRDALATSTFHDRYGIRAGLSPYERARMRRTEPRGMAA